MLSFHEIVKGKFFCFIKKKKKYVPAQNDEDFTEKSWSFLIKLKGKVKFFTRKDTITDFLQ